MTRTASGSIQLQSIEITSLTHVEQFAAGTVTRMVFQVHNLGTTGNFEVRVVWVGRNFVRTPSATKLALPAGAAANVEADIDVPAGAMPGTEFSVTASVTRTTPPVAQNGISLSATVVPAAR